MSYPNLFPSAFIEFPDSCTLKRNRDQPSRENSTAPTLNEFMSKYATGDITNFNYMNLLTYIKYFSRFWPKIKPEQRKEIINLLKSSNSPIANFVEQSKQKDDKFIEHFGDITSEEEAIEKVSKLLNHSGYKDLKVVSSKSYMNIFTLIIVAIVAVVLGFLIACVSVN